MCGAKAIVFPRVFTVSRDEQEPPFGAAPHQRLCTWCVVDDMGLANEDSFSLQQQVLIALAAVAVDFLSEGVPSRRRVWTCFHLLVL